MAKPSIKTGPLGYLIRTEAAAPILVMLVAVILRFYQLGEESLWTDEGCSLSDAMHSSFMNSTRPVYYLLLRVWMHLGLGNSEFALRIPAALFGAASVWALYVLGKRIFGQSIALLASTFMAISTLQLNHAQEVRMYSLVSLMSVVSMYVFVLWRDRGGVKYAAAYFVSTLMLLLTFPLTVFVPIAQGFYVLLYQRSLRRFVKPFLITGSLTVLAWSPSLIFNMCMAKGFSEGYIASLEKPTVLSAIRHLGDFFLWKVQASSGPQAIVAIVFSALVIMLALYSLKFYRTSYTNLSLTWLWLLVPFFGTILLCFKVTNMWMVRYLIAASPAFYLLTAKGIMSIKNKQFAAAAAFAIISITLGRTWFYYIKPVRAEWRPAVQYMQAHSQPGDVVGIYSPANDVLFNYYYQGKSKWSPMGTDLDFGEQFNKWDDRKTARFFADYPYTGKRFWLMLSNHTYRGGFSVIKYVEGHYRVIEHRKYNDLEFYLFDAGGKPVPKERLRKVGADTCHRS